MFYLAAFCLFLVLSQLLIAILVGAFEARLTAVVVAGLLGPRVHFVHGRSASGHLKGSTGASDAASGIHVLAALSAPKLL